MDSKLQRYVIECLAAAGFCLVNAGIAFRLRPDIWATRFDAGTAHNCGQQKIGQFLQSLDGVTLAEIQFDYSPEWVLLVTRSSADLAIRIQYVIGKSVVGLRPFSGGQAAPAPVLKTSNGEPIPGWACNARTEALRAAGITEDPIYPKPQHFPKMRLGT